MKLIKLLSILPWIFVVILFLMVCTIYEVEIQGLTASVFLIIGITVLVIEFTKSANIDITHFILDLIFSVLSVMTMTMLLTIMYFELNQTPGFYYWLGYIFVLVDAILNPFNSFRTALRNFGVGNT